MESKISKLKGIHSEFRHCITYTENGSEVAVQTFLDSFGRTVYGTLGTRGFSRVRQEFSVLAEGRHNFGRRPKPRAATALEKSLAPRLRVRWLATCFAALLRNGFKSYVALFTTYVQTRLHKAGCYKLRDYWLLIFSQPSTTTFWFVSRQASLIREWSNAQHPHSTSSFCSNNVAKQVTRFRCLFHCALTWRLAYWLRLCSHHIG